LLGERYITHEKLRAFSNGDDKSLFLIAKIGKQLAGVQLAQVLDDAAVSENSREMPHTIRRKRHQVDQRNSKVFGSG
jgi:hypothetical protein